MSTPWFPRTLKLYPEVLAELMVVDPVVSKANVAADVTLRLGVETLDVALTVGVRTYAFA